MIAWKRTPVFQLNGFHIERVSKMQVRAIEGSGPERQSKSYHSRRQYCNTTRGQGRNKDRLIAGLVLVMIKPDPPYGRGDDATLRKILRRCKDHCTIEGVPVVGKLVEKGQDRTVEDIH